MSVQNDVIFCPSKPNLAKDVYGETFTAQALFYLRMRDAKCHFAIDTLVNDAWRNGIEFKTPEDKKRCESMVDEAGRTPDKVCKQCVKYGLQFGFSPALKLKASPEFAATLPAGRTDIGIQALHAFVDGAGGIVRFDKDPQTGYPIRFYVKPFNRTDAEIPIDAKDCIIYSHGDEWNGWQGYTALGPLYDPAVGLRLFQGTALRRARDYSNARQLIVNEDGDSSKAPPQSVLDSIRAMMGEDTPHTVVNGHWHVERIEAPLSVEEQKVVLDLAQQDAAISQSIAVTDMTGGAAGNATSTSANASAYFMTAKDVQVEALPFVKKVLRDLGIEIVGFRTAAELQSEAKLNQLRLLYDTYRNAPTELRGPIARRLESFFLEQYGQEVEIDEQPNEPAVPFGGGTPGAGQGADKAPKEAKGEKWWRKSKKPKRPTQ